MTDTTLSLAARLAANLIVDAINLAKPGARLAAKVGDRLLGGSPFNEREAQRFLTMGGSERDVYEPDPLWSAARVQELDDEIPNGPEYRIGAFGDPDADIHLCKTWDGECHCAEQFPCTTRLLVDDPAFGLTPEHNTMPNWPKSSAPVAPKPTDVAGSAPGSAPAPPLSGVDPGHLSLVITAAGVTDLFNQLVALGRTDVSIQCAHCHRILSKPSLFSVHLLTCDLKIRDSLDAPDSEQPVGVGVEQPGTDAAERVLTEHLYLANLFCCHCNWSASKPHVRGPHMSSADWVRHVAPLIVAAVNPQK